MRYGMQLAKSALCGLYQYSGAAWAQEWLARGLGRQFVVVLLFHRVSDAIPPDGLTLGTRRFRQVCQLLHNRFHPVGLGEAFRILRQRLPIPRRTVALTFDDSYRDSLTAGRILTEYGLPATFFLPTGYIETERRFPWDRHLPQQPNLTWDEVRQLVRMGFEVGSHTVSHPNLARLTREEALWEMAQSRTVLEEQLGQPIRWFAYPFGGIQHGRPDLVSLAEQAGYEGCLSGFGGFAFAGSSDPMLPREAVSCFQNLLNLELHLAGSLEWYYALRRRLGLLHNSRSRYQDQHTETRSAECGTRSAELLPECFVPSSEFRVPGSE